VKDTHRDVVNNLGDGMESMDFLSSMLAGFLVGYLADLWLGTSPWLVITCIIVGSVWGFVKMKRISDRQLEAEAERLERRRSANEG